MGAFCLAGQIQGGTKPIVYLINPVQGVQLFCKCHCFSFSTAQKNPCRRSICAFDFEGQTENFIFTGGNVEQVDTFRHQDTGFQQKVVDR
jgi:hypothetical protein